MTITLFHINRIVAAFLIVMIHQQFWKPCAFVCGLENCAVPIFACMAGYLYRGGLVKKVSRIVVPYCIWTSVYFVTNNVVFDVFLRHESFEFPDLRSLLFGGMACHLWFLPCLFAAFAANSLMFEVARLMFWKAHISDNLKHQTSNFILLLLAIASQFVPGETSATFLGYCRIYFGRLLLFFSLGGLIQLLVPNPSNSSYFSHALHLLIGACLTVFGLVNIAQHFIPGLAFQPLPLVAGLMLLAVGLGEFKLPKFVNELSKATMGIYLVHVLLTSVANFVLVKFNNTNISATTGVSLVIIIFAVCYMVVRLMPKCMKG